MSASKASLSEPETSRLFAFYSSLLAYRRQRQRLPALLLRAQPRLLLFTSVVLLGLMAMLSAFGAGGDPVTLTAAEISLRSEPASSNLNFAEAAEPEIVVASSQPPRPLELAETKPAALPLPAEPAVEPVLIPAHALRHEPRPIPLSHPGESTMMNQWKTLGMHALLAGSLCAAAASAQEPPAKEPNRDDVILKQLKDLKKSIDDLRAEVAKLQTNVGNLQIEGSDTAVRVKGLQGDIALMKKQMAALQKEVDALKNKAPTQIVRNYPAPQTGRIVIRNDFSREMLVVVNGRFYRVQPGDFAFTPPLPAGNFTYEVVGVQAQVTRTLPAGEDNPYVIRIHPR